MYDGDHMTAGGWIFAGAMMVLLIVLVVVAILWLVRWSEASRARQDAEGHGDGAARDVLDRRLASGEIDEEEYRRVRAALTEAHASPPANAMP